MKDIWIIHNSGLIGGSFGWQYESYADGIRKNGFHPVIISSSEILPCYGEADLRKYNALFAIFLDKDLNLAAFLEGKGMKVYNSSESIRICDDKALTYSRLAESGVKIPPTLIAPKVFCGSVSAEVCLAAGDKLGYPIIVKECFGSFGMQVYLAETEKQLIEVAQSLKNKPFVFQKYLKAAHGWDVRAIVSCGEILGAVKRNNTQDFRANVAAGGSMTKWKLSNDEKELILQAAQATQVKFGGIDIIFDGNEFVVCEVNSNMHFKAAQQIINKDISKKIVKDLILYCLNK